MDLQVEFQLTAVVGRSGRHFAMLADGFAAHCPAALVEEAPVGRQSATEVGL